MAKIEYFYAAHSAFAYIGSALLSSIRARTGCTIVHRPYDLRRAIAAVGPTAIGHLSPAHRSYFFGREIERWAEARGVPIMNAVPTHHANDITLPNCLLIAALQTGKPVDDLAHALLEAHWVRDADLANPATLHRISEEQGFAAAALLEAAVGTSVIAQYDRNTNEAIARSVFGSPTYFVDGDMFYGQDHLELVERALARPFAARWPR